MALADRVHIARRFQRSVRIDTDVDNLSALDGFVCPQSSADVLLSMLAHSSETGHSAFTWTGPYGSGKSSLAVALSGLLSGDEARRKSATYAVGTKVSAKILDALSPNGMGWQIVPVVGRRENPVRAIGEALEVGELARCPKGGWSESKLVAKITQLAQGSSDRSNGVIVFVDEMGKFLEGAAQSGGDVYVFQQLAEAASRSNGRLFVVGILHQTFEEYGTRLSREQRDEWSKIQGRFVDLPVNVAGEEQLNLISRAIEATSINEGILPIATAVADLIREQRPAASSNLEEVLVDCWPLHPVVACLLGPISRRRFGQNQRSIFGFLNSAETQGLQEFLRSANDGELYTPLQLWDYLQYNLEPSILASPDGHRWSLAVEAVQRCEALGGDSQHIAVLKAIALVDMFRERSGLIASEGILLSAVFGVTANELRTVLNQLQKWALVIHRKFASDFAIFAGSDFDIDQAVEVALSEIHNLEFSSLRKLADLQPILAKRHYHKTGALRWFDVDIAPVGELLQVATKYKPERGTIGQFILAIPTEGENDAFCQDQTQRAAALSDEWDIVAGFSPRSWNITALARELLALETVKADSHELAGDPVARREVNARSSEVRGRLEEELHRAFDNAFWFRKGHQSKKLFQAELNSLASDLADERYRQSPIIFNELLNRLKPSSNAIAAQNALLRRMVMHEGESRLGIDGFPAEGGLFSSLLDFTGLYSKSDDEFSFKIPAQNSNYQSNLTPIWRAATEHLQKNDDRAVPVSEIYEVWRKAPYGVRDGLMPILVVAYILSSRQSLAFYRDGIFQGRLTDLDMDYLAKDPRDVQLRWMNLSELSRRLLSGMSEIVRSLDKTNTLTDLAPIDVARGLIGIYVALPPWTKKTMRLSRNALLIRQLFKKANDPNKFLFDDLPETLTNDADITSEEGVRQVVVAVREGLEELSGAYSTMLHRMRDITLAELQVPNTRPQSLAELRERADNIRNLMGDLRLDAFVGRLAEFNGSDEHFEGLASLAANKPVRDWADPEIDKAAVELTDLAQKFVRAEAFARVKGRQDKRQALAVIVGIDGRPTPVSGEFDVTDSDKREVDSLIKGFEKSLNLSHPPANNVVLAALAEMSARYLEYDSSENEQQSTSNEVS